MAEIMPEFEAPIFKRLPKNDTGEAVGHQAGFVVPKILGEYFPDLPAASSLSPAPSVAIRAILFADDKPKGTVETVYQHQTWGGTRSPERRVTANLRPLLGSARRGDILLIERSVSDDLLYRFTLVAQGAARFEEVNALTGGRDWGVLQGRPKPASSQDIRQQEIELVADAQKPFEPFQSFEEDAGTQMTRRVARGRAFRRIVKAAYGERCAMCGGGLVNALGRSEVEAAHIISRAAKGADDVRNGLALCRAHHWAFDQGMICVGQDRRVLVRPQALVIQANASLHLISGRLVTEPDNASYAAHADAFAWHERRVFYGDVG